MRLSFNANNEEIAKMVESIEKETRCKAEKKKGYTLIGDYTLTDDGILLFDDDLGGDPKAFEHSASVIDECICACGRCPIEFEEYA